MKVLKRGQFLRLLTGLTILTVAAAPTVCLAASVQPTVNLGTVSTYGVLAGQTITNIGPTTVGGSAGGDLGVFPGSSFTGLAQVTRSGSVHLADTAASQAQTALVTAYNDAAGRTPVDIINTELGGQTLAPGVYASEDGTFRLTGTLTLDGGAATDPVYIFLTSTDLVTATDSNISLINVRPCRVFWKIGSSATLGVNSNFVGHLFAVTSISANTGAKVRGQLLARNAQVSLLSNTVTNGDCVIGPAISVAKTASPQSLTSGPGSVTYTYFVTNPGTADISQIKVADDKISPVTYVSGDLNSDQLLQPSEIWIYTAKASLTSTTKNTATASGSSNRTPVSATTSITVNVSTVKGGRLPDTGTPWLAILVLGALLALGGVWGGWTITRRTHG
jgi:hypothetical protein